LRKNTVYEFAFSVYNKVLDFEVNVGSPAKIQTGADDFVSISIWRDQKVVGVWKQRSRGLKPPTEGFGGQNYSELRIYYRAEGTFEWLPALTIDGARWAHDPNKKVLWACQSAIASLPGGQPGAFVDYSPLADDQYKTVLVFQNRVFWISDKSMTFSLRGNAFAYPARNYIAIPSGTFRGAIAHAQPGETEQRGRLIVFGSKENYIGRFTGARSVAPIQVSPDTIAEFEVDGSDFTLEPWTSVTAFSSRAACIADGELYYWGPQGIRYDNGSDLPDNVSRDIQPWIFTAYDPAQTDRIHCTYNEHTHEIIWFYPPKVADPDFPMHGLSYNVDTGRFLPLKFAADIDWSQKLNIQNGIGVAGERLVVGARADAASDIQRAYFFDSRCRSGDMRPTTELMVKEIATQGSYKRLTLATGYDSGQFATIAVGDPMCFDQFADYSGDSTATNCFVKVAAIGAGYLDVEVPAGAVVPDMTLSRANYVPIWHMGLNGIAWQIETGYWMPGGSSYHGIWLYLWLFAKIRLLKSVDPQTIEIAQRTMTSASLDEAAMDVALADNCDGNWQLYHSLAYGDGNINGQAIRFRFAGTHLGSEWVLQYLEAHANEEDGNVLKQFEG
jgi:hypothetical protein